VSVVVLKKEIKYFFTQFVNFNIQLNKLSCQLFLLQKKNLFLFFQEMPFGIVGCSVLLTDSLTRDLKAIGEKCASQIYTKESVFKIEYKKSDVEYKKVERNNFHPLYCFQPTIHLAFGGWRPEKEGFSSFMKHQIVKTQRILCPLNEIDNIFVIAGINSIR